MKKNLFIILAVVLLIAQSCKKATISTSDLLTIQDLKIITECRGKRAEQIYTSLSLPKEKAAEVDDNTISNILLPNLRNIAGEDFEVYYTFIAGTFDSVYFSYTILPEQDLGEYTERLIRELNDSYGDPITDEGLGHRITNGISVKQEEAHSPGYSFVDTWQASDEFQCQVNLTMPNNSRDGSLTILYRAAPKIKQRKD